MTRFPTQSIREALDAMPKRNCPRCKQDYTVNVTFPDPDSNGFAVLRVGCKECDLSDAVESDGSERQTLPYMSIEDRFVWAVNMLCDTFDEYKYDKSPDNPARL